MRLLQKIPAEKILCKRSIMLALFGFFLAVAYDAPFWVFVVGFLCLLFEGL